MLADRAGGRVVATVAAVATGVLWPSPAAAEPGENALRPALQATVATGDDFTCAVTEPGGIACWGANDEGQLGNGFKTPSAVPVAVDLGALGERRARSVVAGTDHACALLEDGAVACWGDNAFGQLGTGDPGIDHVTPSVLTPLPAGTQVRQLAAGAGSTCALTTTGAVLCWGSGPLGEAGTDPRPSAASPSTPRLPGPARGLSAGSAGYCAALVDARAVCWGASETGQLGEGTFGPYAFFPNDGMFVATPGFPVATDGPIADLAPGERQTLTGVVGVSGDRLGSCALLTGGAARCWGSNTAGRAGGTHIGTYFYAFSPYQLPIGRTAVAITAGGAATCALLDSAQIACAGGSPNGQLGQGTTDFSQTPLIVPVLRAGATIRAISSGPDHHCATFSDGTIKCWGEGTSGQLGNGATTSRGDDPGEMGLDLPAADTRVPLWRNEADVAVTLEPAAPSLISGQTGEVTVTVRNDGPEAAAPTVALLLPGVDVEAATAATGTFDGRRWRVGALASGADATLTLRLGAGRPGTRTLVAEVEDTGGRAIDSDSSPDNGLPEDDLATSTLMITPPPTPAGGGPPAATTDPGSTGIPSGRVRAGTLVLATRRARDRRAPYAYALTATLRITAAVPQVACRGTVRMTVRRGARRVVARSATLSLRAGVCAARATVRMPRSARAGRYRASAAFAGNDALLGTSSRAVRLRAG